MIYLAGFESASEALHCRHLRGAWLGRRRCFGAVYLGRGSKSCRRRCSTCRLFGRDRGLRAGAGRVDHALVEPWQQLLFQITLRRRIPLSYYLRSEWSEVCGRDIRSCCWCHRGCVVDENRAGLYDGNALGGSLGYGSLNRFSHCAGLARLLTSVKGIQSTTTVLLHWLLL